MFSKLMPYDSYERHTVVDMLLNQRSNDLILDAGGVAGLLTTFVKGAKVIALNIDDTGDVMYEGKSFPFASDSFDAVVSLDVLEHIPPDFRRNFVQECIRVAKRVVLIAAPFGTPGHSAYEARLDKLYHQVHGTFHRWLHEHVINGLPNELELNELKQLLDEHNFSATTLYAGNYEWQCQNIERSLLRAQRLGKARQVGTLLDIVTSLALWHQITLSECSYDTANRFYLLGQKESA